MKNDLNHYFRNGLTEDFFIELKRFVSYLHKRYNLGVRFDDFYQRVYDKTIDFYMSGKWDESRGSVATYIYYIARNESSNLKSKGKKQADLNDQIVQKEYKSIKDNDSYQRFILYAKRLGIKIEENEFVNNLHEQVLTPIVKCFLWKTYLGA